jgi:hypothetical protein
MPIEQNKDNIKRLHFMLSDFPPWQVFRWTYDTAKSINIVERFDVEKKAWVTHDNDLIRGAFHDQEDAALTAIPVVTDAEAAKLSTEGWTPELTAKMEAAATPY